MNFSYLLSFQKEVSFVTFSLLASFSKGNKFREVFLLTSFSKEVSRDVFFAYFFFKRSKS